MVLCFLAACEAKINSRGNNIAMEKFYSFKSGKTTTEDVLRECGTPSLHKDNYTWIYVSAKSHEKAFQDVKLKEKCVIKMVFNEKKILKSIEKIKQKQNNDILMDEDITPLLSDVKAQKQIEIESQNRNR
jgi:outer membrane protein assembly factor BamE (lipoprotein component of BamABCDE complex)